MVLGTDYNIDRAVFVFFLIDSDILYISAIL